MPIRGVNPATGAASTLQAWATSPTSSRDYVDPPSRSRCATRGKQVIARRRVDGQGRRHHRAWAKSLQKAVAPSSKIEKDLPAGITDQSRCKTSRQGGDALGGRVRQCAHRGRRHRAGGQLHQPGAAHQAAAHRHLAGPGGGHHHPAGARHHVRDDVLLERGPAQDQPGQPDHRSRPARGRRHHCRGDDGPQAGRGLRPRPCRHLHL